MRETTGTAAAGPLTGADRAALVDAFGALEPLAPGLAARLVGHVETGDDPRALVDLAALGPEACKALRLKADVHRRGDPPDEGPAWRRWLDGARRHDAGVLLRLVKVVTATPVSQLHPAVLGQFMPFDPSRLLRPLDPPGWLEPLLWEFGYLRREGFSQPRIENRLTAALVEDLLRADGYPGNLLYRPAFPVAVYDPEAWALMLVGGLVGYAGGLLQHPAVVNAALARTSAKERVRALELFQWHGLPAGPYLNKLVDLTVCSSRTVREVAATVVAAAGAEALPPLRARAASGTAEERLHAVQAIGRVGTPEAVAALRERSAAETSGKVKAALGELLSGPGRAGDGAGAVPSVDVFRGVALPGGVKDAIAVVAGVAAGALAGGDPPRYLGTPLKAVDEDALDRGFALLVQPTPWDEPPGPIWAALRWVAPGAFIEFLRRPELTPLHAVRLLCLAGDLRADQHGTGLIYFDYETPLKAYRESHDPPPDLRTLGAAFRASALDDLLIARHRLQPEGFRRFDWPDEATWPYFAEHLDWLEAAYTASPERRYDYGLFTPSQRRQGVLAILAAFPAPAGLVGLLWGAALGASKAERPLAQRCLEKQPDTAGKVVAALTGGRQEARIAAAGWAARLRPEGLAEALHRALAAERSDAVRDALIDALATTGAPATKPTGAAPDPRDALDAEAARGLKAGVPKGLDWFPFDDLPEVRWCDGDGDGAALGREARAWLVVQAWKAKSPEPGPILRGRVDLFRPDDALRLGAFALDAWLGHDLRPPRAQVVQKRTAEWDVMFGQVQNMPGYESVLAGRHDFIHQPEGNATADKGLLAVAAACGAETAAAKVRAYLDQWYGTRVHSCRALVQMLAWVDRPEAVETLLAVAKRFRTKSIRQEAETQARRLAGRKGLTLAELADQALPDLGLDGEGRLTLDLGGRRFVARLDDDAEVILEDESGHRLASLPAPRKADDPEKAAHAREALGHLKTRARAMRKAVSGRLYEAMCTQRAWRFADWRSTLQAHPLAGRLCRRLVWSVDDGPTFRLLDDGSLTDPADGEVRVGPEAPVRLAHALTVTGDEVRLWRAHLVDYEVSPPFDQFPPDPFRLPEGRRGETSLEAAVSGAQTPAALQRLTRGRGYDPLAFRYEDGGNRQVKHFPGAGLQAALDIEADDDEGPVRSLTLSFLPAEGDEPGAQPDRGARPLGKIPPVLLSECRADLMAVAGSAGTEAG